MDIDISRILDGTKIAAAVVAAFFSAMWGHIPGLFQVLLLLQAIDILTGLVQGFISKSLSSDVGFRGVFRKVLVIGIVAAAAIVEPQLGGVPVAGAVAGFYIAHEALSILENATRAGLPVPDVLKRALEQYRDREQGRDGTA